MKKKKSVQKEVVSQVISLIDQVETLDELEEILGTTLTSETLSAISKEIKDRKRKLDEVRRRYASTGNKELVQEQKIASKELNLSYEKFLHLCKSGKINSMDIKEKKYNLIQTIEEGNYWLDKTSKDLFDSYSVLKVHGDRIDALRELANKYVEAVQEFLNMEAEVAQEIREKQNEQKNPVRKYFTPWLKTPQPVKKLYEPYEEKLSAVIERAQRSKIMLNYLRQLEELESIELSKIDYLEITTESLLENGIYIIPTNETERTYQKILQKIEQGVYQTDKECNLRYNFPKEIIDLLDDLATLPRFQLDEMITLANHVIKRKRSQTAKETEENMIERKFLKRLEQALEELRPTIYMNEEDTRSYYDILETLLQDDRNYDYIKKLLEIEEFQRARQTIKVREGKSRKKVRITEKEHIVLYVLDSFIKNYKLKLLDQKRDYVEPTYYKEIIKLFIEKGVDFTSEEFIKYNKRIEEFRDYIKSKGYQGTVQVLEDINEIGNIRQVLKKEKKTEKTSQIENKYEFYQMCLDFGVEQNKNRNYQEFFPSNTVRTFQIEGVEPFAFSIEYLSDGSRKIGVHILDTTKILNENQSLIDEMKNNKKEVPKLDQKRVYPTMSFQTGIGNDNVLYHSAITPANILIETCFSKKEIDRYREIPELKEMINWCHLLQLHLATEENFYQESDMKNLISTYLSKKVSDRLETNKVPFIYKTALPKQLDLIEQNHNSTCNILSKIPREKAHKIYHVLDSKEIAENYYIPTKTENSQIEFNPTTEVGVYLLETLHEIQEGNYEPDEHGEETKILIGKLNSEHEYVPRCLEKYNDKTISQMGRAYKKAKKG